MSCDGGWDRSNLPSARSVGRLWVNFCCFQAATQMVAYGIGADYQGQGYASASVRAGVTLARNGGLSTTTLMIAVHNAVSMGVAKRTGFMRTDVPLVSR